MGECGVYSFWPVSHFIMYTCLGFSASSWWWLWFILGVGWELFEYELGVLSQHAQKKMETRTIHFAHAMGFQQYGAKWMNGSFSDLVFNAAGLAAGMALSTLC